MTQLIIRMLPALVIIIRLHGWLGFPLTSEAMSTYLKFDIAIITLSHYARTPTYTAASIGFQSSSYSYTEDQANTNVIVESSHPSLPITVRIREGID